MGTLELRIKPSARSLLTIARERVKSILSASSGTYRPDLSDAAFLKRLRPVSDRLQAARKSFHGGDKAGARRQIVHHFLERKAPRFFCDPGQIAPLVAMLHRDRPAFAAALRSRVDADLDVGLPIASVRGMPLTGEFDWANVPAGPGDDDLYSVQPQRYGFMPRLALGAHVGMPTLGVIASLIEKWIAATEADAGEAYLSALVVLYRVIALSWTFAFIAGLPAEGEPPNHDVLFVILKILCADTEYLKDTIGDSYPNNHLLADGFAGWYYGTLFPEFQSAARSRERGEAIFLREIRRQFYEDGASFEHATHYHELGCEMVAAYVLLSRRNGIEPRSDVLERAKCMIGLQVALSGPEAVPLPIGDSTEDPLFPLDAVQGWASGAMRELYRAVFDPDVGAAPSRDLTVERAFWLLGGALVPPSTSPSPYAVDPLPQDYAQGGFFILEDPHRRARLVFRSGPMENAEVSAGHAHADLLSVYLSIDGVPMIVDSGTYTYRLKSAAWPPHTPDWRSYFAGPQSHNGPMPGADPYGSMPGDFRNADVPCRVRSTRQEHGPGLRWLEFEVTRENPARGYRRGVVHIEGHYWVVYDIAPNGSHAHGASIGLQFAPGTQAAVVAGTTVEAVNGDAKCRIALSKSLSGASLRTGSIDPLGGWVSPRYGEIVPAPQLIADISPGGDACAFALQASPAEATDWSIDAEMRGESWLAFRMKDGPFVDFLLVRTCDDGRSMAAWDVEFDGALVWLRTLEGEPSDCQQSQGSEPLYRGERIDVRRQA